MTKWMLYGANGYSAELIAREAVRRGFAPVLAGRNRNAVEELARELQLESRVFSLAQTPAEQVRGMSTVLNCAGPFSATAAPMIDACIAAGAHYLDITGEIDVFEMAHTRGSEAKAAGIILCPGVGLDVIPTDCIAARLKEALPDASHLALGFSTESGVSRGTAKTIIEGLAAGSRMRKNGAIICVPFAQGLRQVDFHDGQGQRLALRVPLADVASAYYTTGIPTIEGFTPAGRARARLVRVVDYLSPVLRLHVLQRLLKAQASKQAAGPDRFSRERNLTYVWGEATNRHGVRKTAWVQTANGYNVTIEGALSAVSHLLQNEGVGGFHTPSQLLGADLVTKLPGSGALTIK